jgi:hypothetical protein
MIFRPLTLEEANSVLSFVQNHFVKVHELIAEGQRLSELLSLTPKKRALLSVDGGTGEAVPSNELNTRFLKRRLKQIEGDVRDELFSLQCLGANVKSVLPARVTFLTERHHQPAYFSWQMGEAQVKKWHWPDEGFHSRRMIDDAKAFGDALVH